MRLDEGEHPRPIEDHFYRVVLRVEDHFTEYPRKQLLLLESTETAPLVIELADVPHVVWIDQVRRAIGAPVGEELDDRFHEVPRTNADVRAGRSPVRRRPAPIVEKRRLSTPTLM